MKTYKGPITKLNSNQIFVFGSNFQGKHGAGAAKWALLNAKANYGQPRGLQGQSYGIITKDLISDTHPSVNPKFITDQIEELYEYAREHPNKEFLIAYSGTGINLNGYTPSQMAKMFKSHLIPDNVVFEEEFNKLIN